MKSRLVDIVQSKTVKIQLLFFIQIDFSFFLIINDSHKNLSIDRSLISRYPYVLTNLLRFSPQYHKHLTKIRSVLPQRLHGSIFEPLSQYLQILFIQRFHAPCYKWIFCLCIFSNLSKFTYQLYVTRISYHLELIYFPIFS